VTEHDLLGSVAWKWIASKKSNKRKKHASQQQAIMKLETLFSPLLARTVWHESSNKDLALATGKRTGISIDLPWSP
jgi:hypothetical protein